MELDKKNVKWNKINLYGIDSGKMIFFFSK